ncbi:hypothetical protein LJC14_06975, partial [Treponema sp. OttesenSCG-928-L16]|nr:hypothetical protein [Treponema sp. OttesenSCG-928-L16]
FTKGGKPCPSFWRKIFYLIKHYSQDDVYQMENLKIFARISIKNRIINIYFIEIEGIKLFLNVNKLILVEDSDGNFLDALGVILPHNKIAETTFINDNTCVLSITLEKVPILGFLYISSDSEEILLLPRNNKFVASVCVLGNYIYYSTENDYSSLWRVDVRTGILYSYPVYYPNVDLYISLYNGVNTIFFTYNNKNFIIRNDSIIQVHESFTLERNKQLRDYLSG